MVEKHPIDQIFREKLGDFEMNPPVGLLDQIHQEVAFRGRVRRMTQLKTIVGIAAALVLAIMAGWYTITPNQFADTSLPTATRPKDMTIQPGPVTESQTVPVNKNPELALQQNQVSAVAIAKVSQIKSAHAPKKLAKSPASNDRQELLASQTPVEETAKAVSAEHQSASSKEEKKSEPASKTIKRGAELPYFADANSTPASRENASVKGSWGIKAELSPMFSPTNQSTTDGAAVSKSISTVSGGMIAAYKVNDKLSISTGMRFSQMKQGTHTTYALNAKSGINYLEPVEKNANIAGDVSLNLPSKSSIVYFNGMRSSPSNVSGSDISQDFKYLEIPIQATYKLLDEKLSVGVTGGISTNILVGNYASITENGIKLTNGSTQNLRDVIYSGSAGLEVGYGIGKNLTLTVEPRIKQYMHSVSSNDQINYKPLQMGIFTGITYSFN